VPPDQHAVTEFRVVSAIGTLFLQLPMKQVVIVFVVVVIIINITIMVSIMIAAAFAICP
jgi:hypothetical protein